MPFMFLTGAFLPVTRRRPLLSPAEGCTAFGSGFFSFSRRDSTLQEFAIQVRIPRAGSTQRINAKYPTANKTIKSHSDMLFLQFDSLNIEWWFPGDTTHVPPRAPTDARCRRQRISSGNFERIT